MTLIRSAGTAPALCAMLAPRWPLKQQSRRRSLTPDGFALSPIRAVFSDSIVRVVERAVK